MAVKCQQNIRQLSRTTGGRLISEARRCLLCKKPPWCRKLWGVQGGGSLFVMEHVGHLGASGLLWMRGQGWGKQFWG